MKGQYLAVEWIFFFAIGITLVMMIFSLFSTMGLSYRETTVEIQLGKAGEMVRNGIINTFKSSETGNRTMLNISIPTRLSGCIYTIEVSQKLRLRCVDNPELEVVLDLYGINTNSENIIYSTRGFIQIRGTNGRVDLL